MHYYKFHIKDYSADTAHLNIIEDICYRRLIDCYCLHEQPIPADITIASRLVRMPEHSTVVEQMLNEFFTPSKKGWINKRADEEIITYHSKKSAASAAGKISAEKRKTYKHTDVQQPLNARSTDVEPTINHKPLTNNHIKTTTPAKTTAPPNGVCPELWLEYLAIRKRKKGGPVTERVLSGLYREATKADLSLEAALTICVERGWQSFNASWVDDKPKLTVHQQQMQASARTIGFGRTQQEPEYEILHTLENPQLENHDHDKF